MAEPLTAQQALRMKQKELTAKVDSAGWHRQLSACSLTARAILRSEAEPGARAFLAATPVGRKRMESAVFVTELRQRLGLPEASEDKFCPKCEGMLDVYSLHASTCAAGGERALRHNCARDVLCEWAEKAGLRAEKERPGLLLPQRPEEVSLARRRPADIFLPALTWP